MTIKQQIVGGGLAKALSMDEFFSHIDPQGKGTAAHELYKTVAWVHRAVQLRANALATVPYLIYKGEEEVDDSLWPFVLADLLWRTEAHLCLFGAAYWLIRKNSYVVADVQVMNPQRIRPKVDELRGLTGFEELRTSGQPKDWDVDDIVYFRGFNPNDDLGPGLPPVVVASEVGKIIQNSNAWAEKFFENSAIPAVIIESEYELAENEEKRIRAGWNRLLQGVKRAFRTLVLTGGLKAKVIGQPVKDLAMPELALSAKRQIATAFGIPLAMFEENAANRATAQIHRASFYTETIIPEAEQIARTLNDQFMQRFGFEFAWQFNRIEALQREEAEKASAVRAMLQSINESHDRDLLDDQEARGLLQAMMMTMGLPSLVDLREMDIPIVDKPEPPPAPPIPPQFEQESEPEEEIEEAATRSAPMPDEYWQELARWRKVAQKDATRTFETRIIPESLQACIRYALREFGPDVAFSALKQDEAWRDAEEQALFDKLMAVFDKGEAEGVEAVAAKNIELFDFDEHAASLQGAMSGRLRATAVRGSMEVATEAGIGFDPADVNSQALRWAREHAGMRSKTLTETTRKQMREALAWYLETPEADIEDLTAQLTEILEPAFGEDRARTIAITETTDAHAHGAELVKQEYANQGFSSIKVWITARDDRVCPICGPMDGAPEGDWEPTTGPPAHPNCRCGVRLSFDAPKVIREEWQERH